MAIRCVILCAYNIGGLDRRTVTLIDALAPAIKLAGMVEDRVLYNIITSPVLVESPSSAAGEISRCTFFNTARLPANTLIMM
jgi:hypothetical protein